MVCSDHLVGLHMEGAHHLRQEVGGKALEGWTRAGNVAIVPAEVTNTWECRESTATNRGVVVFVPQAFLSRVIEQDWGADPKNTEIVRRFLVRDPVIEVLLTRLAYEATNASPSGSIYAESACEFLAHHLIRVHSSLSIAPPSFSGGLPARRLKLVLDYIEENLARPITLRQLADLTGVSSRHFERAFRQTMGVPPHGYVLQRRVTAARHLMLDQPTLAIHEVALRSGFSGSSHFAAAFRRRTGYTPGEFRRLFSR